MFFQRYSIAARIGFVVGIILIMMLALALVEIRGLNSIRSSLDNIVGKHYQRLQIAQDMRFLARHGAVLVRNVLLVAGEEAKQRERERFEEGEIKYNALLEQLAGFELTEDEQEIIKLVVQCGEVTFELWRTIVDEQFTTTPLNGMEILEAEVRSHQWGLLDNLNALVQLEQRLAKETMEDVVENYSQTKTVMVMINILAIGAGLFSVVVITGSIVGPLHQIGRKVDKIARGDFSTRIEVEQKDEIGQLAHHINRMVEKLQANEEELKEYRYNLEELIEWRTGEMNEQRERFISVLIHDLKGPLVPIVGFSRLLLNKKNLDEEQIERYVLEIYESTSKLATVIEQTSKNLREKRLAFSFDKEPFDIEELLWSVSKNCQPDLKAENIELRLNNDSVENFNSSGEILYSGDISKFRSLLENLIGNAAKYAQAKIEITVERKEGYINIIVDDDGCGVAKPFRRKIFEEYYQVPGSKDGTGVGLYSVKRIVDHYRGKVRVTTSPAGGARFIITLPRV
jgi:signal transduction histidine kinase